MTLLRVLAALAALGLPATWAVFVAFARQYGCGGAPEDCTLRLQDFFGPDERPVTMAVLVIAAALLLFAIRMGRRKDS